MLCVPSSILNNKEDGTATTLGTHSSQEVCHVCHQKSQTFPINLENKPESNLFTATVNENESVTNQNQEKGKFAKSDGTHGTLSSNPVAVDTTDCAIIKKNN